MENFDDRVALLNLKRLVNEYDKYCILNVMDFYNNFLMGYYGVKAKISSGPKKDYYENFKYKSIAVSVRIHDDESIHKTIHKSKGDEFENVFLIIKPDKEYKEEKHLDFLFNPNINMEENRVYYVALSRAEENLFINIPSLSIPRRKFLEALGFEIFDII